jgi:hypothetical protein
MAEPAPASATAETLPDWAKDETLPDWAKEETLPDWAKEETPKPSTLGTIKQTIADPLAEFKTPEQQERLRTLNETMNPFSEAYAKREEELRKKSYPEAEWGRFKSAGRGLMTAAGLVAGPVMDPLTDWWKSQPSWLEQAEALRKQTDQTSLRPTEAEIEFATGMVGPAALAETGSLGIPRTPRVPPPEPAAPVPLFKKFPFTEGELTGDAQKIKREQQAREGIFGPRVQQQANEFYDSREGKTKEIRDDIQRQLASGHEPVADPQEAGKIIADDLATKERARYSEVEREAAGLRPPPYMDPRDASDVVEKSLRTTADVASDLGVKEANDLAAQHEANRAALHPQGKILARSPQEAADMVSAAVTRAEEQATEARDAAYEGWQEMPGTYNPAAYSNARGIVQRELNAGDDPVILNNQITRMGVTAMREIDTHLGAPARAALDPNVTSFKPITPAVIDDVRKRLVALSRQAYSTARATNDFSDVRAMGRITSAFDKMVAGATRDPKMFSGDGAAVADALDNARSLHADLRQKFSSQGSGDKVGPIIQQIVGQRSGQAMSASEIKRLLYGSGEKSVLLARRMRGIIGEDSDEYAALRQGLYSDTVERPEGVTDFSAGKMADRVYELINGKGRSLAHEYLTPQQQRDWTAYADRTRASIKPPVPKSDIATQLLRRADAGTLHDALFEGDSAGQVAFAARAARHVAETYGRDSEAFQALQSGKVAKLTGAARGELGFNPQRIADNLRDFVDGKGKPLADELFPPEYQEGMRRYAGQLEDHAAKLEPTDPVEKKIASITGRDGGPGKSGLEVIDDILGSHKVPADKGLNIALIKRLYKEYPEGSPERAGLRVALYRRLAETPKNIEDKGPQATANSINKFMHGEGKELSDLVWTPEQKEVVQAFADLNSRLIVPKRSAQPSHTSGYEAPLLRLIAHRGSAIVGGFLGSVIPGVGHIIGMTGGLAWSTGRDVATARSIAKQLNYSTIQVQKWQKAVAKVDRFNSPSNRKAAAIATVDLGRALAPLGISLHPVAGLPKPAGTVQGAAPAEAEPDKGSIIPASFTERFGPGGERKDGGQVGQDQSTTHGAIRLPEGARMARDGRHYLPDQARPGKYLMVLPAS